VFGGCCGGCLATPTTPKPPVFKGFPSDFALKMVGVGKIKVRFLCIYIWGRGMNLVLLLHPQRKRLREL
jgi:hypothetical protein